MACFLIVWQKKGQATRFPRMLRQLWRPVSKGTAAKSLQRKRHPGPYAVVLLTFNASAVCTLGRREAAQERELV